jgi:hypothetical protein
MKSVISAPARSRAALTSGFLSYLQTKYMNPPPPAPEILPPIAPAFMAVV